MVERFDVLVAATDLRYDLRLVFTVGGGPHVQMLSQNLKLVAPFVHVCRLVLAIEQKVAKKAKVLPDNGAFELLIGEYQKLATDLRPKTAMVRNALGFIHKTPRTEGFEM